MTVPTRMQANMTTAIASELKSYLSERSPVLGGMSMALHGHGRDGKSKNDRLARD
jgi:hypothetical protein